MLADMKRDFTSAILNDAWQVRHYKRNRLKRAQAILKLGHTVRHAFTNSKDFESLLKAVINGLCPDNTPPF